MSLPFYQKYHEHYDRGYRSKDLRSTMSQYQQEKKSSAIYTHGSTAYSHMSSAHHQASEAYGSSAYRQGSQAYSLGSAAYSLGSEVSSKASSAYDYGYNLGLADSTLMIEDYTSKLSPQTKRAKRSLVSGEEKENQPKDYVVPIFSGRQVNVNGITDTEEERIKETAAYVARRNLLATGEGITTTKQSMVSSQQEELFEKKSRKVAIREKAERLALRKTLEETEEFHRKLNEDSLLHAPEFVIKPRSHTVWEKQNVRLHCSVSGWPEPRLTWYKNHVPINVHANPGKYIIESRYGMHYLEINACDFEDTAQYRASAMNVKGELSAYASIVVKRYKGEYDETRFHAGASTMPLSFGVTPYGFASKFEIHFDDKFDVSFGREGETMSLGCRVVISPEIKHFQPEVQWLRNGTLVSPSKWVQTQWSGDRATLTFSHLNKEDEGLYTLRVRMGEYYEQYSAYVFVRDADAEIAGAPASPLDVVCLDANKDYVIISWKQPAVDGGSPILGYFIDKCEVGTDIWSQCNDTPVKFARFPVTGLIEGRSYIFRVRAVNKTGISIPSRVSEPVAALDPVDRARLKSQPSAPWTGQIIVTEEEPAEGVVPGPPTDLSVTEATRSYVVLSWKPPGQRGHEGIMYFVEKCVADTENWQRVNTEIPVKSPRFALFDLAEGKSYRFRVRCSNSAGVGEPSEATDVTVVGDKLDIPKAPGQIIPSRNTDTSVVVTWEESKDAKELVGYYIESSVVGSNQWEPCNNNPVKGSRFICHGLLNGQSYIFRVRAVNAAGLSEYSQDSEAIEVKAAIGGGVSQVVWPELNDKTGGLTDYKGGMHEASLPTFKKAALLDSGDKFNQYTPPSSSDRLDKTAVSKVSERVQDKQAPAPASKKGAAKEKSEIKEVSETVQEDHTPPAEPPKAADQGKSKSDPAAPATLEKGKKKKAVATPSPPYDITCLESFRDSMVLGWKQPDKTGGAEITGYYVNYREVIGGVPGKWKEANIKAVSDQAYKISNLKENMVYQFQVAAVNIAGVGTPSQASASFKCEEWTIAVPGPPHGLKYSEVRKTSLVLQWKHPVYSGRTPVTGFFVDIKETKAKDDQWRGINEKAIANTYLKVQNLKEGVSYVFRVRALNQAGVGKPSDIAGPVVAETRPGTKEIVINVDDDGVISLNFECDQMSPDSKLIWSKDYVPVEDSPRLGIDSKGNKSKATFKDLGIDDLGIYSCDVTDTDGIAASYLIDEEEMKRLLALSQEHKFPTVPLKSELAVEIMEKGEVRFWMQAEKLSGNSKANYIFNDKEIFDGPKYKMHMDQNTGIIEMIMEKLENEDEGTYTFQIQDGKATNQSTLVLIGDVYKNLQKEAEFQRKEWVRKQGPHFAEYLSWEVTGECNVLLKCKVANIKKETHIVWYKDEREITVDEKHDFKDGICTLLITEFSKKDAGFYEVILKDDRGKDKSVLKLVDEAFKDLMTEVCKTIALSATELKIQSTAEGIRLYSFVNYYLDDLKVSWSHNGTAIKYTDRVKSGVTGEQIWLQINEPTPNDKGKYVMELFDGKTTHERKVDLSGQAYDEAFAEFQRLKQAAIAEKNRARVLGGLPDVVTIQEGKALNLTCNLWGDPSPEISWLKNEKSLDSDEHCILKLEAGKTAFFTITAVQTNDSGKYSLVVKNKYGTETSDFTVSVFLPEEEAAKAASETQKQNKKAK
ncbi:myomesin-1 isoform X1 [Antechinus flavipes]|uniref:myomesin-1 isoform X1 n=1 Tax=Antechinus flavipes TaxID=38775 RepID=UPI00223649C8|nr:myomesin-1 isoform X1 [Antechinus flavipes]XP_051826352.1 myomesin-1 isoform X1 [Antechinus flavipes]